LAWIALEGIRFYAYHGFYEAEQVLGAPYTIDIYIQTKTSDSDDIGKTINYEMVHQVCRLEMEKPRKLIETVAHSIIEGMKYQFGGMQALRLRLRKHNPPIGGSRIGAAFVEIEENFMNECPRCKKKFIFYNNKDEGWGKFPNLHPATRETLERQFGGKILCEDCLKFYAG
jgi:7,8-dihydroneopterin aldolase/epimerase/oxygenase